jgi:hypothetical protein
VTTYRTGNHWGITIVRESLVPNDNYGEHDQLVAVVVNGDQALAERICALLNFEASSPPPVVAHTCTVPVEMCLEPGVHAPDAPSGPSSAPLSASDASGVHRAESGGSGGSEEHSRLTGMQERADVRRRIAEQAEHRPSSLGDGLGYGPCVGCGQLWPCVASRDEISR